MTTFLLLSIVNLALGFVGAFLLEKRRQKFLLATAEPDSTAEESEAPKEEVEESDEPEEPEELGEEIIGAGPDNLPVEWRTLLDQEGIAPQTLLEGAVHTLRVRSAKHLANQVDLTRSIAELKDEEQAIEAAKIPKKQKTNGEDWGEFLESLQTKLEEFFGKFGRLAEIQVGLDTAVNAHINEIKAIGKSLDDINFGTDYRSAHESAAEALRSEINAVTGLRDYLDEVFASIIDLEGRIETVDQAMLIDQETSIYNRAGLDFLLHQFRKQYEAASPLSFACFEIDQFDSIGHFNDLYIGDRLLQTVARVFDENVRKARGFDRLVRLPQGRILLVLGDTELNWAAVPAERIRSIVEHARFRYGRVEMRLSVSGVLSELRDRETIDDVLRRLDQGLLEAREGDGNSTATYKSGSFEPAAAYEDPVRQMEVEIDEREEVLA